MAKLQTITAPSGEEMVVLPRSYYDRLLAAAAETLEDAADLRDAKRVMKRLAAGEEEVFPHELVKRARRENAIKVLREYRGLTQVALAEAADIAPLYLSQLECGRATGGINALTKLAKALNVDLSIIAPRAEPPGDRKLGDRKPTVRKKRPAAR